MTDLKPCPQCNSDAVVWGWDAPGLDGSAMTGDVECRDCGHQVIRGSMEVAIAAWNRRVGEEQRDAS